MFWENIKEAFASIRSNKMRSLLTMLGIIIGISSVILITTIGGSIRSTLTATLNSLGGNTIQVNLSARYPENDEDWDTWVYPDMTDDDYITDEMIEELKEMYPDKVVGIAAENYLGSGQVKEDADPDNYANVTVNGMTPEYIDYIKIEMYAGRNITTDDNRLKKRVCLIADTMAENYFNGSDPIGEQLSVTLSDGSIQEFTVVGVYKYNQAIFGKVDTSIPEKDRSTTMMIPLQTSSKLSGSETSGYDYFNLLLDPLVDVEETTAEVQEFFDAKYAGNQNFCVYTYNMQSDMGMINTVLSVITLAVSGIAAISLIVGGVGVMNIMLVSITERTREIGVRMALGAKRRTIRMQFVIEAIVLCLIGGIIGVLIGVALGILLGNVAGMLINNMYPEYSSYIILSVHPSIRAILLSLFFSMLIGVFFGYYPANKASKMEVIDALRYE
jgi:putative ABC transport system permease protein